MRAKHWIALLTMCVPGWAGAIDMEYYTYNAFEETVAAFQRVSLVLQDPAFTVFVGVFAIMGVLIGGLIVGAKGMQGRQVNPVSFLIPVIVGVALFRGFVWPTGNLFVYDPVRNATQAVGDVPDAVVLMAGTLNKIERGVSEIIQTASADPAAERSGALRYSLILNALNSRGTNLSLERNLVNYYLDCGLPSMSIGFNGVSHREAERRTDDLYDTFARFAHPTFATFGYTGAGDASSTMSCAQLWTDHINPALNGAGALADVRDVVCAKTGFDMAVPTQSARCDEELQSLGTLYGLSPSSSLPFIRSTQLSIAMTNALRSGDISVQTGALVNRQVMAEGMGVAEALDRWVPKVRGFMTAAVLGMVPLALLFVVTPLMGKALQLLAGLFLWITLWGIADAIAVSMAADAAADSFDQMRLYGFSHMSFMLSPEGAVQALGVFGKSRAMALMMATVLSYALFQFGGYAFTSMANSWQNDVQQMGEAAGKTALMPEERAAMMQRIASGSGTEATFAQYGMANVAGGSAMSQAQSASEARRISQSYISPGLNGPVEMGSPPVDNSYVGAFANERSGPAPATGTAPASGVSRPRGSSPAYRGRADTPDTAAGSAAASPAMGAPPRAGAPFGEENLAPNSDQAVQEVVVTGHKNDEAGRQPSGFSYVDDKVDMREGATMGEMDAHRAVAEHREGGIFEVSREASAFPREQQLVSTLTEKGLLTEIGQDARTTGYQAGQQRVGSAAATTEILENVSLNENVTRDSAEAAVALGRQERGEMIGATRAGSTESYVQAATERARRSIAEGEQFRSDGLADEAGRADAISAGNRGVATARTTRAFGREAMIEGVTVNEMNQAAFGAAVYESGDPAELAHRQGQIAAAEKWAHIDVVQSLGRLVGVDTTSPEGLRRLAVTKEGANQTVTISGNDADKEQLIKSLGLDQQTADLIRAHDGGLKVGVALADDGQSVYASITAGGQTFLVDETSVRRGITVTANYEYDVGSGRALAFNPEALSYELDQVYGDGLLSGEYNEMRMAGLVKGLAAYYTETGQGISATSQESVTWTTGLGVGVGIGKKGGAAAPKPVPAEAEITASGQKLESDGRTTSQDLSYQYTRYLVEEARADALTDFRQEHGTAATEADRKEVLERMSISVREKLESLDVDIREEVEGAQKGHDVDPTTGNRQQLGTQYNPGYPVTR